MSKYSVMQMKSELTAQQLNAANVLVDNEFELGGKRSLDELGEEIGVSRQTIWAWRKQAPFIAYMDHLTTLKTSSQTALVNSQLMRLIHGTSNNGTPSIKAIELYLKLHGKLTDKHEIITHDGNKPALTPEQVTAGIASLADKLKGSD